VSQGPHRASDAYAGARLHAQRIRHCCRMVGRHRLQQHCRWGSHTSLDEPEQPGSGFEVRCSVATPWRSAASRLTVPLLCRPARRRCGVEGRRQRAVATLELLLFTASPP